MLRSSIDFTDLEVQKGDTPPQPFSYETDDLGENKVDCYISWTNDNTKQIIMDNIHRSPLYGGKIEGVGPRYCPSFEDKIMRFKDLSLQKQERRLLQFHIRTSKQHLKLKL